MNRTLIFASALAVSLASSTLVAQTPAAPATPPPAAPTPVAPEAVPAKIAIIVFRAAVAATNEGQKAVQTVQAKYESKGKQLEAQNAEIENLQKQYQAMPANAPDEDRAKLSRDIDAKTKQFQLDEQQSSDAYNADMQAAIAPIMRKVGAAMVKYATEHGFTMVLNYPDDPRAQEPNQILWTLPSSDITEAVVNAYNASSGVPAPTPSAPTPQRRPTAPATTAPKK